MVEIFMTYPNQVINHKYFVIHMFGGYGSKDSVKDYVCVLRQKTDLNIKTHYGKGYELVAAHGRARVEVTSNRTVSRLYEQTTTSN